MLLTEKVERDGSGAETMRGALLHGQRSLVGHTAWLGSGRRRTERRKRRRRICSNPL